MPFLNKSKVNSSVFILSELDPRILICSVHRREATKKETSQIHTHTQGERERDKEDR